MVPSAVEQVRDANAKLRSLISRTKDSLAGRCNFNVGDVRAIAEPVGSVQPIVDEAATLRATHPDLDAELETYKRNLEEVQVALEQMGVMLIARRAHVESARGHLATLSMWNATLRLTR